MTRRFAVGSRATRPRGPSARLGAALLAALCVHAGLAWADAAPATPSASSAPSAPSASMTLPGLMARFAASRGVAAHFVETKELALLVAPLESTGRIYFMPPRRLARYVDDPVASRLTVDGDALVIATEGGVDRLDLGASEVARHFVEGFVVLFSGDLPELERRYAVRFEARGDAWQMQLEPRQRVVRHMIESIALRGRAAKLEEMHVVETQGDRATTRFDRIDSDRAFGAEEAEALFGSAAPAPVGEPVPVD